MSSKTAIQEAQSKAQDKFFTERVKKLSSTFFPSEDYHPKFKETIFKLLKFNSRKQMGVHPKTWENMCSFQREFMMPEMEVCLEILDRTTPNEIINLYELNDGLELKSDEKILKEYNEVEYPKIHEIADHMRKIFNAIDKSISIPLANKINSDTKLSLQLPIGSNINFVALPNHG